MLHQMTVQHDGKNVYLSCAPCMYTEVIYCRQHGAKRNHVAVVKLAEHVEVK